jgi:hypothetical protein
MNKIIAYHLPPWVLQVPLYYSLVFNSLTVLGDQFNEEDLHYAVSII